MTSPFPHASLRPVSVHADAFSASFDLPAGHPCFDGHFPGQPILPGIAHLALAAATRSALGLAAPLRGVRDVRFTAAILPGDRVDVSLLPGPAPDCQRFELRRAGALLSSGTLLLTPAPAGA